MNFEHLLRDVTPQVLGSLIRRCGDLAAAEDAVQEGLLAAATQWPRDGIPENPQAWLMKVSSHRLTDEIRSNAARRRRETESAMNAGYAIPPLEAVHDEDDTLVLLYMCCHPALTTSSAIALTLRAVGGLTTSQIARAFFVPEATMAQRISRAKQTIKESGVTFAMPAPNRKASNLQSILHVLYLIFNEGYAASEGEHVQRRDLANEAIRLTRIVHAKSGDVPEVAGLLALMLLTDARRLSRTDCNGEMIPLDRQDRRQWDGALIAEGTELVSTALKQGNVGPYQLQAAIAALHDEAKSTAETDWPQICALYEVLLKMYDNPMVRLNHAVAFAMVRGPEQGLSLLAELEKDERLGSSYRFYGVRGHLNEMAGAQMSAVADYQTAALKTASLPERNYLLDRAARLRDKDD